MFKFMYCGKSSVGESFPLPSPLLGTGQSQPPRVTMKEHPHPCQSTSVPIFLPLPWPYTIGNPHIDSNWWCHRKPVRPYDCLN